MSDTSFWKELKDRRVLRVGIVYLAAGWALIEGADTLSGILDLPDFTPRLVLALVMLGFPVAMVLSWTFQVTPEGVRRAKPFAMTGRFNLPFLGGLAVGILAVSGLAFVFSEAGRDDDAFPAGGLGANAVVVMPFRVSAPADLSYLGAGLMDLLAARLDGEVGPRAVDPGAVVSAASRDSTGSLSVARGLGAGLVLTGSIVGGTAGIVASAEYTDVSDGRLRASASASGHPDSLAAIADQLIIQLLSLSSGEYTTSIAALTSTSPRALKAYLRGKQAFREGRYYDAIGRYDEALALDSTFALAAIARADGATNALTIGTAGGLERAWRHRERLGPRDLMYLEARLPQTPRTGAENIAVFERLTRAQPDRVEAWYWLGEHVFHARGVVYDEAWAESVRAVFHRTLELDPGYFPAVDHLIFLEPLFGTPDQLRAISEKLYERPTGSSWSAAYHGFARGKRELTLFIDSLPSADPNMVTLLPWWPIFAPDQTPDDFVPYVDAAFQEMRRRVGTDITLEHALRIEYRVNLAMGRPGRAEAVREERIDGGFLPRHDRVAIYDALWAGVALEDAAAAVREIDDRLGSRSGIPSSEEARDLTAAEVWRYRQDPDYAGDRAAAALRVAAEVAPHPQNLEMDGLALLLEAWGQVRRDDPRAKASLVRLVSIVGDDPHGDLVRARLLFAVAAVHEELGDFVGALEVLDREGIGRPLPSYRAQIFRERGRLAALTGDAPRAIREYGRWLTLQAGAEPSVAPEVEAVRAEVARLQRVVADTARR